MQDTRQQQAILRQSAAARATRRKYPVGTRVRHRGADPVTGVLGTVCRHVPTTNAQGGHLSVQWDNGVRGSLGPINAIIVEDA
jgi:hypothetical protein